MSRKSMLFAVPLLAMAAACVNVQAMRLGPGTAYPSVPKEEVRVYEDEADVSGPFEKLAVLYADGDVDMTSPRQMIDAARKKAGRMGANAIVIGEFREPRFSTRVAAAVLDVPVERRARFLAIRTGVDDDRE
jgi:hypothetical protein